ncbi:MAG: PHP domain-containing protein [Gemmatimonadota bacterium]|nr:PHP domain-containing protein [Gemmatimonadota bacterium]
MEDAEMTARYDLHLHTYWSYDALAQPESHFRRAREMGVECFTITDHHVLDSLPEVLEIASGYPDIRVVPSAELTMTTSIGSVDLLCYGFPADLPAAMIQVLEAYHDWQRAYGAAISAGLQGIGLDFTDADRLELLKSYRPSKTIVLQGNTHVKGGVIQRYCVERGYIERTEDYADLMARAGAATRFPPYPHVRDAMPAVKEAGALVAIAHPFGYFREDDVERMDALRVECSLDGIECAHPSVPPEFTAKYREYCERHGMFSTGGSDSHTDEDVETGFAGHGGPDEWLDEFLNRLD